MKTIFLKDLKVFLLNINNKLNNLKTLKFFNVVVQIVNRNETF